MEVTVLKVGRRGPHPLREIAQASPSPLNAMVSVYPESLSSSLVLLCPCSGDQGPLRVYSPQGAHVCSPEGTPLTRAHSMMDLAPPCQSQHPLLPVLGQLASCLIPCACLQGLCPRLLRPTLPHGGQLSPNPSPGKTPSLGSHLWTDRLCVSLGPDDSSRLWTGGLCISLGPDVALAVPCQEPSPCHPRTSGPTDHHWPTLCSLS